MTGRYLVWDGTTVTAARSVIRMPDVQKWDKDKIAAVALRPWQMHEKKEPTVLFRDQTDVPPAPSGTEPIREARRLYIKRSDVEAYGYTQGCPKCDHDLQYGFGRTTKGHSDTCRRRISERLMETPAGRARIAAATGRLDGYLSEFVEKHQQAPAQGENAGLRRSPDDAFEAFEPIAKPETFPVLPVPDSVATEPRVTAEDLLREEAIEATFKPGLWEPGTSLYPTPAGEPTTIGANGGMDIDVIY